MLTSRAFQSGVHDPWDLTLGELMCVMSGAMDREVNAARSQMAAAWMGAALGRSEKMVPLEVLLGDMTMEELHDKALEEQRSHYEELSAVVRPLAVSPGG